MGARPDLGCCVTAAGARVSWFCRKAGIARCSDSRVRGWSRSSSSVCRRRPRRAYAAGLLRREGFNAAEREKLVRGFLPGALFDNGLYCRPDDRGDVVVQVAPPLICDQAEFDEMEQILRHTLTEAQELI